MGREGEQRAKTSGVKSASESRRPPRNACVGPACLPCVHLLDWPHSWFYRDGCFI